MSDPLRMIVLIEPAPDAGEADVLRFALDRSRNVFAWKCGGLDEDALRRAQPPSAMTIGGLLKHLAMVEDWTGCCIHSRQVQKWRAFCARSTVSIC